MGLKVLITSPSNAGVDKLLESISLHGDKKVRMVRIGNPSRVNSVNSEYIFDNLLKKALKGNLNYTKTKRTFQSLIGKMSLVNRDNNEKKKKNREINEKSRELLFEMNQIERITADEIVNESNIVATTLSSIYDKQMKSYFYPKGKQKRFFDVVVIDEAGQALDPMTWMGVIHGKRLVMAGDHQQLPPTIKSPENKNKHVTLFERLIDFHKMFDVPVKSSIMLRRQYRMNSKIMKISSQFLYNDFLIAHESVEHQTLASKASKHQIINNTKINEEINQQMSQDNPGLWSSRSLFVVPLFFVDTKGSFFGESEKNVEELKLCQMSKLNDGEAELTVFITLLLIEHYDLDPKGIGIITPYSAQVDNIRRNIEFLESKSILISGVEVSTVDAFQGREKDAIIISTVRSNSKKEIGFLKDVRRMNVAITRAKKLLCLVGDSSTIQSCNFLEFIVNEMHTHGVVKSPLDFDGEQVDSFSFEHSKYFK